MQSGPLLLLTFLTAAPVLAADGGAPARQQAHQHGAAGLDVSVEGSVLQIALDSPADNLVGFEHAPRNEAQKRTVNRVEQQLRQPATLFTPSAQADCRAEPPRVEIKLPPPGSAEAHSEVEAEWRWQCARPAALAHVDVGLFKAFPRLRELRAQIVTAAGQRTLILTPAAPRLKIAS